MKRALVGLASFLAACEGDPGPAGEPGAPGAPGSAIDTVLLCFDRWPLPGVPFSVETVYQIITYTTGETQATCSISDDTSTFSNSFLWPARTPFAAQATCRLTYDFDGTFTGGFWTFSVGAVGPPTEDWLEMSAVYSDPFSAADGTILYLGGECILG